MEEAWQASNGLRVSINEARNRQQEQLVTVADLVDHYTGMELSADPSDAGKSHATKTVYRNFFKRWVKPGWGNVNIVVGFFVAILFVIKHVSLMRPLPLLILGW
jgi:hypothetical protein